MKNIYFFLGLLLSVNIVAAPKSFYDDFSQGINDNRWILINKQWGGDNGGVSSENVTVTLQPISKLLLKANGDQYTGEVIGINGKIARVGAAVATKDYYPSGTFSVCAKLPKVLGAASAFWLFSYKELTINDAEFEASEDPIRNSEIDWEMPSDNGKSAPISYRYAKLNAWGGQTPGIEHYFAKIVDIQKVNEGISLVNDNQFHKFEIVWQPRKVLTDGKIIPGFINWRFSSTCDSPSVSVYTLMGSKTGKDHIPQVPMQLWLGIWFPASYQPYRGQETGWAGTPNFEQTQLEIKWVRIMTP